jgi:uncharacterized protein
MANRHGEFFWYELMTRDPIAAKAFYDDVVGWDIGEPMPGDVEYRQIMAGSEAVGGVLRLTDEMCEHGARPVWLGYVCVDDVDETLSRVPQLGGSIVMPAQDVPDVGRFAMVADPQGVPFYIMRGAVEGGTSTAFDPMVHGHCSWNELATTDQPSALGFYGELFGWTSDEGMEMGDMGTYRFLDHHGVRFGAVSPHIEEGGSPIWTYYFHVPDVDAAMSKTKARGGQVLSGPHEVPGGDHIMIGADPEGVMFALVGRRGSIRI